MRSHLMYSTPSRIAAPRDSRNVRLGVAWLLAHLIGALFLSGAAAQELAANTSTESAPQESGAEADAAAQRSVELFRELELQRDDIERRQAQTGAYDLSLIESHYGLGNLLTELEDFEAAAAAYNEALQLSRINHGLYSQQQLPSLNALIDSRTRLQQWQEVDNLNELRLHLASRLYMKIDRRYLELARQYGRWKIEALNKNLLRQSGRERQKVAGDISRFYDQTLSLAQGAGLPKADLLPFVIDKSETDLMMAKAVAATPFKAFDGGVSPFINERHCQNVPNPNGGVGRQCYNVQVENPRYRESQYQAKQFALNQRLSEVTRAIGRLEALGRGLPPAEAAQVDEQVARLKTEYRRIANRALGERVY